MPRSTTKHDLPDDEQLSLYHELLEHKQNGRLARGKAKEILRKYGISRHTLSKIWTRGQLSKAQSGLADVVLKRKGRAGRRPSRTIAQIESAVKNAPPHLRRIIALLTASSGIPPTTLWRVLQSKKLVRRTSRPKPMVTEKHKEDRVAFVRSFVRESPRAPMRWHDMHYRIHIDEKWFYLTLVNRRYYLWYDEAVPVRKCSSKLHIVKEMFLTAVARPRFDYVRKTMWDGKLGMWPLVAVQPAQRTSKNRDRGTLVATPVTVTKKAVWPGPRDQPIYIQQYNARPHVEVDDPAVVAAGRSDGWAIQLVAQPAMSPDFNVLDLGFFNSIQALQHRQVVTGIDDLVAAVHGSFNELDWRILDKTFVTLVRVMEESMKMGGDNSYKLPHQCKDKMARLGPTAPSVCDPDVVTVIEAMNALKDFE
ncbi:hypothetical protein H257_19254, partial [Aphanomyces astaci]